MSRSSENRLCAAGNESGQMATAARLRKQVADLTALREADQATIASLALVNKELGGALEASLALLADSFVSASPTRRKEIQAATNAGQEALRVAGRLP